ncbi:futalosine hydrolase [Paenibacillus oenotherae]|uniref:Futalosine hydrolase n=1 Tax=Paenibacillus oenotherae TaxID=1435645 RepID=A0ABS7D8A3_9BACL|nr:futalosine hydrolase [Paenibacillus oenotherae]MBW7476101.1 futalosine hydrolase [Paenibacillus oenotherae]
MNNEALGMNNNRVLVITAVEAERDAVVRGLRGAAGFDVVAAGVGTARAAAGTAAALAAGGYRLVISAGIGGGFEGRAAVGTVVVASKVIAADLGAETPEGFLSLDELGFGSSCIAVDVTLADTVAAALKQAGLPASTGAVLTVSTVTGTGETASELIRRNPDAAAEAMEGYGAAVAAKRLGLPFLELRTISNAVGPRDRSAWRIKEALEVLEAASAALREAVS